MFLVGSKPSKASYLSKGKFKCLTVPYTNWHLIASLTFSYHSTTHSFGSTLASLSFKHSRHTTALGPLHLCVLCLELSSSRQPHISFSPLHQIFAQMSLAWSPFLKLQTSCTRTPYFPFSCSNFHHLHTIFVLILFIAPTRMWAIVLFNTICPMPRGVPATY